jgi:signal transduction histidine kinase
VAHGRRRLERDLHDGAQQRLVGMALGLQLLARRCPGPLVEEARRELTLAIADVRSTAKGLSPPVLVDAGVSAALRSLAETRPLSIGTATIERLDQATETTVYQLVEEATREASGHVDVTSVHGRLDVRVVVDINMPDLTDVADRIVTLGYGRMVERRDIGTTEICVTLPVPGAGVEATTLPRPS